MKSKSLLVLAAIAFILQSCQPKNGDDNKKTADKETLNIIFLIGDGMGLSQVSTVFYFPGDSATNFTRFKQLGLINTSSAKDKVTDSAAGATAFSNGKKSYNGSIGVGVDSTAIENIVEILSKKGYSSGVISTSSITHATPACYYAHVKLRKMETEIAQQLIHSDIDFFAGGGIKFFDEKWEDLEANFVVDTQELNTNNLDPAKRYGFLLADMGMPKMSEGRGDFLPDATRGALSYLDKKDAPFFLMVEGSQIDWAGHANDGQYIIDEMHDFDKAIGVALDYAQRKGNTLVVVTADHETGGYALAAKKSENHSNRPYYDVMSTFTTGGHTSTLIPVFSYGPGSEDFDGFYQNNDIFHKMLKAVDAASK
jgi:alkaline phosphatase